MYFFTGINSSLIVFSDMGSVDSKDWPFVLITQRKRDVKKSVGLSWFILMIRHLPGSWGQGSLLSIYRPYALKLSKVWVRGCQCLKLSGVGLVMRWGAIGCKAYGNLKITKKIKRNNANFKDTLNSEISFLLLGAFIMVSNTCGFERLIFFFADNLRLS